MLLTVSKLKITFLLTASLLIDIGYNSLLIIMLLLSISSLWNSFGLSLTNSLNFLLLKIKLVFIFISTDLESACSSNDEGKSETFIFEFNYDWLSFELIFKGIKSLKCSIDYVKL